MCSQADALTVKYRQILKRILAAKIKMGEIIKDSSFAMVQAKYVAGEGVKHTIFDAVETAAVKASVTSDSSGSRVKPNCVQSAVKRLRRLLSLADPAARRERAESRR